MNYFKYIPSLTLKAELIARMAHNGQYRKDGVTPYITHPEAVARRLREESDDIIATAWLHDVLEDTSITAEQLEEYQIPPQVINSIKLLTKVQYVNYDAYLLSIKLDETARMVKIYDMLHNLGDSPSTKQILKYSKGILFLMGDHE